MDEFKYLGVLFIKDGKNDQEMDAVCIDASVLLVYWDKDG